MKWNTHLSDFLYLNEGEEQGQRERVQVTWFRIRHPLHQISSFISQHHPLYSPSRALSGWWGQGGEAASRWREVYLRQMTPVQFGSIYPERNATLVGT